jgi:hypothetical protein
MMSEARPLVLAVRSLAVNPLADHRDAEAAAARGRLIAKGIADDRQHGYESSAGSEIYQYGG